MLNQDSAPACPLTRLVGSSIGKKLVMALSGGALMLFIILHLLGNLQIFLGAEAINKYAEMLQNMSELLWPARIVLLGILIAHFSVAFQLKGRNKAARVQGYKNDNVIQASAASRYMLESGVVILIFVIIHLLHFTFGLLQPEFSSLHDAAGRHDVYSMVIYGFQNTTFAGIYIFALLCLGFHLSHAIASMIFTLGFYHEYFTPRIKRVSNALGWLIALGYISIPLAVQLGIINLSGIVISGGGK